MHSDVSIPSKYHGRLSDTLLRTLDVENSKTCVEWIEVVERQSRPHIKMIGTILPSALREEINAGKLAMKNVTTESVSHPDAPLFIRIEILHQHLE